MNNCFSSSSSFVSLIPTLFDLVHLRLAYTLIAHRGVFAMIWEERRSSRTLLICAYKLLSTLTYTKLKISWLLWVFDANYLTS